MTNKWQITATNIDGLKHVFAKGGFKEAKPQEFGSPEEAADALAKWRLNSKSLVKRYKMASQYECFDVYWTIEVLPL